MMLKDLQVWRRRRPRRVGASTPLGSGSLPALQPFRGERERRAGFFRDNQDDRGRMPLRAVPALAPPGTVSRLIDNRGGREGTIPHQYSSHRAPAPAVPRRDQGGARPAGHRGYQQRPNVDPVQHQRGTADRRRAHRPRLLPGVECLLQCEKTGRERLSDPGTLVARPAHDPGAAVAQGAGPDRRGSASSTSATARSWPASSSARSSCGRPTRR